MRRPCARDTERVKTLLSGRGGPVGSAALGCVLVLLASGCGSRSDSGTSGAAGTTVVGTVTRTSAPITITQTVDAGSEGAAGSMGAESVGAAGSARVAGAGSSATAAQGAATAPSTTLPESETGTCPYLPDDELILMTGQRNGPTKVIKTGLAAPGGEAPICVFYRTDGDWMATVRPFQTPSPASAVAAVDARIPPKSSSPGDRPAGWAGGYQRLPDGADEWPDARSVYGVSKGGHAVIAWTNRDQTIKARRIVEASIAALKW